MMRAFLRQPLLHFFLMGAAIFAVNAAFDDSVPELGKPTITVSEQDAEWLAGQFEATWRRQPTPQELEGLMTEFVREEIYVREALSLGLDQDDAIVRRRLRQKMQFLTEAGAEAATPDDETLQAHLENNAERFRRAPRVAFTQVLVPQDGDATPEGILAQLSKGTDLQSLGQRTLLPPNVKLSPRQAVDGTFGNGFFDAVSALEPGQWSGPVPSGFGSHIVRVETLEEGSLPSLADIRERVELDWRSEMAETLRTERFKMLQDQYVIERPDPQTVLAQ
ncbi:MAG: peptidylprolyl isomerase [Roseobacter sp.]